MAREIILDTETTGLDFRSGHRLIEIGCIELEDFLPTGRSFHELVDPEREIDAGAAQVHGMTWDMLRGKPKFADLALRLMAFIGEARVIAHNAAFDRGFINHELVTAGMAAIPEEQWTCTYVLAQKRFPGMHNSLDTLCKRFRISLSERTKHGALIDAKLLAQVYLELHGGKERALEFAGPAVEMVGETRVRCDHGPRPRPLAPRCTDAERAAHEAFVRDVLSDRAVWLTAGLA